MPILQHAKTEHYEWGIWQITESEEQLLAHIDHLYPAYNIQLAHFTAIHRRLEWLATRALLSALIPQAPEIIYNDNGRPHLSDNSYHISISHTKGYAAVILSKTSIVGIDIEQYGRRVEKVTSHFMNANEKPSLYKGDHIWSLLLHWSAKETVFKCLKKQKDFDLVESITIYPFEVKEEGSFTAEENFTPFKNKYEIKYQLANEYVMTYTLTNQ